MAKVTTGFSDIPAKSDLFNIKNYIDGLSSFIMNCETPMTIAIQGDWGTGKSSIMEMIESEIDNHNSKEVYKMVSFNTWQFSQFSLGDQLPIVLLSRLLKEVSGNDEKTVATAETIKKALFKLSSSVVKTITKDIVDLENLKPEDSSDLIEQIGELKQNFQELIDKKAGPNGKVIIFVDDLDRLDPAKAVELLEVLKIFLDCIKCVFILAIDYGVVARGVKAKYGDDFNDEKAKSFFDKIIQVPFKMPISKYKIEAFVQQHFEKMGIKVAKREDLKVFMNFIGHSIGNNPRSMKRLFNSFQLLSFITKDAQESEQNEKITKMKDSQKLFALLCMQSSFEKIYNYIVENQNEIKEQFLVALKEGDSPVYESLNLTHKEKEKATQFFCDFYEIMDEDGSGDISPDELFGLMKVLNYSTMTSASAEAVTESDILLRFKTEMVSIASSIQKNVLKKCDVNFDIKTRNNEEFGNIWLQLFKQFEKEGYKNKSNLLFRIELKKTNTNDQIKLGGVAGCSVNVIFSCGSYSDQNVKNLVDSNPLKGIAELKQGKLSSGKSQIVYENVFFINDVFKKTSTDVQKIVDIVVASTDIIKAYFE